MKKFLATAAALGLSAAFAFGPAAQAEQVDTPAGTVNAEHDGGTGGYIEADGNADNPNPLDGYIGVEGDAATGEGGAYGACEGDRASNEEDDSIDPVALVESGGGDTSACDPSNQG